MGLVALDPFSYVFTDRCLYNVTLFVSVYLKSSRVPPTRLDRKGLERIAELRYFRPFVSLQIKIKSSNVVFLRRVDDKLGRPFHPW